MRYEKYKEANLPWLKEVPEHWEIKNINNIFEERRTKVSDKDYQPLSVTKNGIMLQLENVAKSDNSDNRKKVTAGDLVINSRSDRKGSSGLSSYTGSVSLINTVLSPRMGFRKYWHYLLKSNDFQEEFYRNGKGIVADLWSTNFQSMKCIEFPIPPLFEQDQIANFLDWKINEINRLIKVEKKKIASLNDLNSKIIYKNIDEISEYKLVPLKRICSVTPGKEILKEVESTDDAAIRVFGSGESVFKYTDRFMLDGEHIIFGRKGTIGKPYIVDGKFWIIDTAYAMINNELSDFRFLYYTMIIFPWDNYSTNTVKPSIVATQILAEKIKVPSVNVQIEVATRIDKLLDKNNALINLSYEYISNLQQLKQSLISEVVTGKINVQNIEIPEYEVVEAESEEDVEELEDEDVEELEIDIEEDEEE